MITDDVLRECLDGCYPLVLELAPDLAEEFIELAKNPHTDTVGPALQELGQLLAEYKGNYYAHESTSPGCGSRRGGN